jgi:hypothetical protein
MNETVEKRVNIELGRHMPGMWLVKCISLAVHVQTATRRGWQSSDGYSAIYFERKTPFSKLVGITECPPGC